MTNASYDYLTKSDGTTKIKVDAAERDGDGRQISSFYVRKGQLKTVGGSSLLTTEGTSVDIPFPELSVSTGTSSGSFVKGIAVDGTDKHKLNVTLGNVIYPDISVSDTTSGAIVTDVDVDSTDKHKLKLTRGTISNNNISVSWNSETTIATVAGTAIKIKIPANPNTDESVLQTLDVATATGQPILFPGVGTSGTAGGVKYTNKITVTPSTGYLTGVGATFSGTVDLTRTTDVQGTGTNAPALRIGALSGQHLEFDGNEIMSKATSNTVGTLNLNIDGGQVVIGSAPSGGTQVTVNNGAISATTYNGLTLTSATTGFTIAGGTTSKTLTVSTTSTIETNGTSNGFKISGGNTASKTLVVPGDYTLGAACAKSVTDSSSASAIGTGTSLPTERDIYYGLPTINNAHDYTSSTAIYAPTGGGASGQILKANGATSTPGWVNQNTLTPGVTIATDSGTNQLTLAHNTKYKLTVGASTYIFTTPSDNNTDTLVKQVLKTDNFDRPLLMSDQTISTTTEDVTGEARRNNSIYANTSTGKITSTLIDATQIGGMTKTYTLDKVSGYKVVLRMTNADTYWNTYSGSSYIKFLISFSAVTEGTATTTSTKMGTWLIDTVFSGTQATSITSAVSGGAGNAAGNISYLSVYSPKYSADNSSTSPVQTRGFPQIGVASYDASAKIYVTVKILSSSGGWSLPTDYETDPGTNDYNTWRPNIGQYNNGWISRSLRGDITGNAGTVTETVVTNSADTNYSLLGTTRTSSGSQSPYFEYTSSARHLYFNTSTKAITATGGFSSDGSWTAAGIALMPKATGYEISGGTTSRKLTLDTNLTASSVVTTSSGAASGGSTLSLVTTGEKYTWNNPEVSIASGGTGGITLSDNTLYTLTVGGSTCVFKTPVNTWTALAKGTASAAGTAGYAPAPPAGTQGGTSFLSSAASWVAQTSLAPGVSLAKTGSGGTTLLANTLYTLTVGASTCVFKTSTDTQDTCGANNSSSKLFLVGRTDQSTGVSNSNQYVYTQSGVLYANSPAPTTKGLRNITLSANAPASSDGADGDIWICPDSTLYQEIEQDGIQGAVANRYAACSTAAATVAKTASIKEGTFTLKQGTRVTVVFSYMNTANSPTLNINGTGGFNIYHRGTQITSGTNKNLLQGTCDFVYTGSYWALVGNYIDSVTQVKVGTTAYNPSSGVVSLPAYPTVNNGTLTIKNSVGTSLGTFTANQSSASNISLPPHPIAIAYLNYGWAAEANTAYFLPFNLMVPSTGDASDTGYYPGYYALETHSESWAQSGNHIKVLKKGLYNISVNVMSSPWSSSQRNTIISVYAGDMGLRVYDSGAGNNQCLTGSFCTVLDANALVYVYYSSTIKCTINDSGATGGEWERATKLCVELLEDLS